VGLITLVGLIAKNGILIVQFANTLQSQGVAKLAALREASLTRLRPVLMTSAATVFGHLPLVFATGPGSAARNSIGAVLVAGMTVGRCSPYSWSPSSTRSSLPSTVPKRKRKVKVSFSNLHLQW